MKELQEKIKRMLEGEKKRREVALKFIGELHETLLPIACEMWSPGTENDKRQDADSTAVWIWKIRKGKKRLTDLYYRYEPWQGDNEIECQGFYFVGKYNYGMPVWGEELSNVKGKDFWYCIQILIEWIPLLTGLIDKKNDSREDLLNLIKRG
jgi:hypothetical protein